MMKPRNGGELQQFLCALGWIRNTIPEFAKQIYPLQELKNQAAKLAGSSRTKDMNKILLDPLKWES